MRGVHHLSRYMKDNPILLHVPTQIESERLIIRCPQKGDGFAVFEAVVESLESLREFPASLPWAVVEPSISESERFCRESQATFILRSAMPMLLLNKENDQLVGSSGLHDIDWTVPKCEIGYWIRSSCVRQGFATEAVKAITSFAIASLGMRRIEALPDDKNLRSCLVCERAGYELEGVLHNERVQPDGQLADTRIYAFTQAHPCT